MTNRKLTQKNERVPSPVGKQYGRLKVLGYAGHDHKEKYGYSQNAVGSEFWYQQPKNANRC